MNPESEECRAGNAREKFLSAGFGTLALSVSPPSPYRRSRFSIRVPADKPSTFPFLRRVSLTDNDPIIGTRAVRLFARNFLPVPTSNIALDGTAVPPSRPLAVLISRIRSVKGLNDRRRIRTRAHDSSKMQVASNGGARGYLRSSLGNHRKPPSAHLASGPRCTYHAAVRTFPFDCGIGSQTNSISPAVTVRRDGDDFLWRDLARCVSLRTKSGSGSRGKSSKPSSKRVSSVPVQGNFRHSRLPRASLTGR